MHVIAATFLLPVGVILYTFVGGIKATFLTDYFHTFVITIIICFFTIKVFLVPEIGSPAGLYDLIVKAGQTYPVDGNQGGSYLTMTSKNVSLVISNPQLQFKYHADRKGYSVWNHSYPS
jgi:urea-proton symporter